MYHHNRAYRRYQREHHIERKEAILKSYRADNMPSEYDSNDLFNDRVPYNDLSVGSCHTYWYVKHRGMLSKGKIHCSCPMCRYHGPEPYEVKKGDSMISEIEDYEAVDSSLPYMKPEINKLRKQSRYNKFDRR